MRCFLVAVAAALLLVGCSPSSEPDISAERMIEHVRYLSSDDLEGRAPGSNGERLTLAYLEQAFADAGCAPGNPDGTYRQRVPLRSYTVTNRPDLRVRQGGVEIRLPYMESSMAWTMRQESALSLEAVDLVFVGYGVEAPEYNWNDYKDVDVAGKVIVMLVNDPPHPDESLFGGPAMTYYGRWTYKYEIAAQKGALGAIVIHTAAEAGYPWEVVSNSWSGEQFDVIRRDNGASRCAVEGWITAEAAESLFRLAGTNFAEAKRQAVSRDFRPFAMNMSVSVDVETAFREITSNNVVARIEGSGPESSEHIIFTAHWDHIGVGNPVDGDSIYNGALDNASGVAAVVEIADALSKRKDLKRSVLFLLTTAEESGLLGAEHYVANPLYPLADAVALMNLDGVNVWGPTHDMVVVGYGQSQLDDYLREALAPEGREIVPDTEPEKGYYYRSDHFPFAKAGVPALYADSGSNFRDRPEGWGEERRSEYLRLRYHKPQDELSDDWDLSGTVEDLTAFYRLTTRLATDPNLHPLWNSSSEFKRAYEQLRTGS